MHDSTRRICCRLAFLALCAAPSGSLFTWIVYRATPLHTWHVNSRWEEAIYQATGLLAEIDRVSHPTRSRTLIEHLTLYDPDGNERIVQIRVVELARTDQGLVAIASQPEVDAGQLQRLGQLLYQRVLRGPRSAPAFQLVGGELTVHHQNGALTFNDVRAQVHSTLEGVDVTIDFQLAGNDTTSPAQIQIARPRGSQRSTTVWQVRTGNTPLPCELLADYVPALQTLGDRCLFQGTAWIQQDARSWDGEIAGRFLQADLERIFEPFPHKLSGFAEITLSHTSFRQGRLVEAAGALHSEGGVISTSLVSSAIEALKLTSPATHQEPADTLLAYRQLAFGFQLDTVGLQLSGLCDVRQEGVLLVGTSGNLLLDAQTEVVPSVALTRALVPQNDLQVPATLATEYLLRALPLPQVTPPVSRTAGPAYNKLRVVE